MYDSSEPFRSWEMGEQENLRIEGKILKHKQIISVNTEADSCLFPFRCDFVRFPLG